MGRPMGCRVEEGEIVRCMQTIRRFGTKWPPVAVAVVLVNIFEGKRVKGKKMGRRD